MHDFRRDSLRDLFFDADGTVNSACLLLCIFYKASSTRKMLIKSGFLKQEALQTMKINEKAIFKVLFCKLV